MDPLLSRAVLYTFGFFLVAVHGTHYRMYGYPMHNSYVLPPMVHGSAVFPVPRPGILASPPHTAKVRPRTLQVNRPTGVDFCAPGRHDCEHICKATATSYHCKCHEGYILNLDKKTCSRVDICALGRHDCEQICVASTTSYQCKCRDGYSLNPDEKTCSQEARSVVQIEDPCKCENLVAFQGQVNTYIESLTTKLDELTKKLQVYEGKRN